MNRKDARGRSGPRNPAATIRVVLLAALALSSMAACGCSRYRVRRESPFISSTPTADEVIAVINQNADRVRSLRANDLDISVNQIPLDGKLALEKPRRFRLIATSLIGTEADIGSNDEEFWFYIPRASQRRSLVHCSYEDFPRVQASLPIQPDWVLESLGLTPIPLDQRNTLRNGRRGTIELVSFITTPRGDPATLVTVVELDSGFILERHLEVAGRRTASATLSRHHVDPAYGVVYPGTIQFRWPEQGVDFSVSLDRVEINPVFTDVVVENLWRLPREVLAAGVEDVDLGAQAPSGRPDRGDSSRSEYDDLRLRRDRRRLSGDRS